MTDVAADRARDRKKLVVVMNCQGQEIMRYLRASRNVACQYELIYISSIVLRDDEDAKRRALAALSTAHVVVAQDVSSVEWLRNDFIAEIIPKYCRFFRFCFWRFYGYWPISAERYHAQMWYVCDELGKPLDFHDYIRTEVDPETVARNFEEQVEKFAYIERFSEIRMLPFFLDHYRSHKLFTDEWHPTSFFFYPIARYIISELGLPIDIELLPDDGADNFRHRLVFDAVSEELGLDYDQSLMQIYDACLDRETLYDYFKFAERCYDRFIPWLHPRASFHEWRHAHGLEARETDVSRLGRNVDPARPRTGAFGAWRTRPDGPERSWAIDLRDFRKITALDVWLSGTELDEPATVPLRVSNDGRAWTEVAAIRLVPGGLEPGAPVPIAFQDPVLARHVRLDRPDRGRVSATRADVFTRAITRSAVP